MHADGSSGEGVSAPCVPPLATPAGWWRWGVVAGYLLAIFWASSRSTLPSLPGHPSDKLLHFVAYAGMSLLMIWAATRGRWRRTSWSVVLLVTLVCTAYGVSDELHQRFVPNRQADLADLVADALGGMTAGVAAWVWGILSRGRDRHDAV
jgi:VanZ family protein